MFATKAIPISSVVSKLTIKVRFTGLRTWGLRLKLASPLFRLAAWVAGTTIELSFGAREEVAEFDRARRSGEYRSSVQVGEGPDALTVPSACSIERASPLFDEGINAWGPLLDIYLDGAKQDYVVAFDVERGAVRAYLTDAIGQIVIIDGEAATTVRQGAVELRRAHAQA